MDEKRKPTQQRMTPGPRGGPGHMLAFERPKNTRKTILRLLKYLDNRKLALAIVIVLMLIGSASMLIGSYFLKPLINDYILPGDFAGLARALLFLGGIYLVGIFAIYFQTRLMVQIAQQTTNRLRRELFVKMQELPLRYFDTHTHGDLMSRYTNDIDNVQLALEQSLVQLVSSALTFVGSVVMMIVLSPILFGITATTLVLMVFLSGKLGGKSRKNFQSQQKNLGNVNGYVEEMVDGLKVIKVFTHEKQAIAEFKQRNEAYRQAATDAQFYAAVVMPVMANLNNISYALTAMFGGILAVVSSFDIGSLAAFLQYSRQLGMPVQQITNQFNNILSAMAGAERVFDVMDQEPEQDAGTVTLVGAKKKEDGSLEISSNGARPSHWVWKVPQPDGMAKFVELQGDVRFDEVTFGYEPDKTVLHKLSLYAKPGQKIAFVGSTGAGKTTVTNLINRFYDITDGLITYDGIDIRQIRTDDLRLSLGMVLQDTHLFSGSILDNIRYGRLDATDEECVQAAKQVNAHSFIKRLPDGYQTVITGDGANLSQGQRQLLAIARAAVADPPVMILDEATSSIDTRTERLIEKGMDTLMKDRTVFVIAHRLSTVRNSNAILVLENGQVIERGDHEDLLEQKGRYYQLYTGQYEMD
jgi:ATP-binding cassette subfamily B multidrug efflux pump